MNQNHYRNKPSSNIKTILLVAGISISIPFGMHLLLKPKQSTPVIHYSPDPGYGQDVVLLQSLNDILNQLKDLKTEKQAVNLSLNYDIETNKTQDIVWLDSPVMQTWNYNEKSKVWETALPYKDSFRSSPTLIFGLREDGIVVWRKLK
jgi:hypothetical protein